MTRLAYLVALAALALPLGASGQTTAFGSTGYGSPISPAQITATQNNYAPTGCADAVIWRLTSDASRSITGINAATCSPAPGVARLKVLVNDGANPIILEDADAGSDAANRFELSADYTLAAGGGTLAVFYDPTEQRWRPNGLDAATGGSGETNTASNLGGGLANWDSKVGVDLRFNSFAAADFDLAANLLSIDDTKWAKDSELPPDQVGAVTNTDVCQGDGTQVQCNIATLANLNTALGSSIADGPHTTDTNAGTICTGTTTYLDGEGNCDDLSTVYQPLDSDLTSIAALTTTAHGRGLLDDADAAASRASISAQAASSELDNLINNCTIENDATPIPDSCVGDGSDAGGGGPTILGANVTCAVSASYCTAFTVSGGSITASRALFLEGNLIFTAASTTVAGQFRVRSADTGYTGNCNWLLPESTTATTALASDNVAIGTNPGDTAGTTWFSTAAVPVRFACALIADASPGDIVVEFQLETGTSPTQTVHRGSYYTLTQ